MSGRAVEYRPGVHYFATRLFDLDFARLGSLDPGAGRESIVDFPRGDGHHRLPQAGPRGGRLVGALMIGERSAKVRGIGRAMKRLIDTGADVTRIKGSLLDPGFDFDAFLDTERLLEKPSTRAPAPRAPAAKVRGTQLVGLGGGTALVDSALFASLKGESSERRHLASADRACTQRVAPERALGHRALLSQRGTSLLPQSAAFTQAIPSGQRGTRVLSIGLQAEAPPPHRWRSSRSTRTSKRSVARSRSRARRSRSGEARTAISSSPIPRCRACTRRSSATRTSFTCATPGAAPELTSTARLATTAHQLVDGDQLRGRPHRPRLSLERAAREGACPARRRDTPPAPRGALRAQRRPVFRARPGSGV